CPQFRLRRHVVPTQVVLHRAGPDPGAVSPEASRHGQLPGWIDQVGSTGQAVQHHGAANQIRQQPITLGLAGNVPALRRDPQRPVVVLPVRGSGEAEPVDPVGGGLIGSTGCRTALGTRTQSTPSTPSVAGASRFTALLVAGGALSVARAAGRSRLAGLPWAAKR